MTNNFKFFQNIECEFFPCHKVEHTDRFNCMFCYCPLYFLDCGGKYQMNDGVKDCSDCTIPHFNRKYIIDKIKEQYEK